MGLDTTPSLSARAVVHACLAVVQCQDVVRYKNSTTNEMILWKRYEKRQVCFFFKTYIFIYPFSLYFSPFVFIFIFLSFFL